ncbi:MAG: D-alanine--D-alanine ligase [Candidatus Kapabacteria bacterium]|nr:D-alanine--D-alanine ligase [Candidatus Kapabacteria bacterium]
MNIAVVFGGISPERNVSINGGRAITEALRAAGHNVIPIDPAFGADAARSEELLADASAFPTTEELAAFSPRNLINCVNSNLFDNIDIAFLVLHGKNGEDGLFQSLLELRGIPYTGSKVLASALAMNKLAAKLVFSSVGVNTPPWSVIRKNDYNNLQLFKEIISEFTDGVVVKPVDQGSSIGVSVVLSADVAEVHRAVLEAAKFCETVIIEQFIEGRELHIGIIGDQVLPIVEVVTDSGFYDYSHKYTKGKTQYFCPADLTEDITEFAQNMAITAFNACGCTGFGRVDFRLDEDGVPYCLEVNTLPGFTTTSLVPMAASHAGFNFTELCELIINNTLGIDANESDE